MRFFFFLLLFVGCLQATPFYNYFCMEKEDAFCTQAKKTFPQLEPVLNFLQSTGVCTKEEDLLQKKDAIVCKLMKEGAVKKGNDFIEFHDFKKQRFQSAVLWDKKTPDDLIEEALAHARAIQEERDKDFLDNVRENRVNATVRVTKKRLEELRDACEEKFNRAVDELYGYDVLQNKSQWALFWAVLFNLHDGLGYGEEYTAHPYLASDVPNVFRDLCALGEDKTQTLFNIAVTQGFVTGNVKFEDCYQNNAQSNTPDRQAKLFAETINSHEGEPVVLLGCGNKPPVAHLLAKLKFSDSQISPWNRCCDKVHGYDVISVDEDPRQLPCVLANFCVPEFWQEVKDRSIKHVVLEEPRALQDLSNEKLDVLLAAMARTLVDKKIKVFGGRKALMGHIEPKNFEGKVAFGHVFTKHNLRIVDFD